MLHRSSSSFHHACHSRFSRVLARTIFAVAVGAICATSVSAALAPQSLTLSAPQLSGSPGDTLTVNIQLSSVIGVTDLSVMKFAVRVDTLTLRPLDAFRGSAIASWPAADFHYLVDGDRLSVSAMTATPQSVGLAPVPVGPGELVRMRFVVRDVALDAVTSPLDITATNDEQSIVMLTDPAQSPPGVKTVDIDGSVVVTNGFTCLAGDASGDGLLATDDAILALRLAGGMIAQPTVEVLCGADANRDREYNAFDASWILSAVVGLPLAKEPGPSAMVHARLLRRDGELWLEIRGAGGIRAAELRLDAGESARWLKPEAPQGSWLASDQNDGQLRLALAATRSVGEVLELRLPVRGATEAQLIHLQFYGSAGERLPFVLDGAGVAWNNAPPAISSRLKLESYPNPFNPATTLRFDVARGGHVRLEIFDAAGRKVVTLLDEEVAAGTQSVEWHGLDARGGRVSSGVYFARVIARGQQARQRLLLVK